MQRTIPAVANAEGKHDDDDDDEDSQNQASGVAPYSTHHLDFYHQAGGANVLPVTSSFTQITGNQEFSIDDILQDVIWEVIHSVHASDGILYV